MEKRVIQSPLVSLISIQQNTNLKGTQTVPLLTTCLTAQKLDYLDTMTTKITI